MGIVLTLIALLATQLLLGGLLVAATGCTLARSGGQFGLARRRRLAWFEAARSLGRPLVLGLMVASVTALPVLLIADLRPGLPYLGPLGFLAMIVGSVAVAACTLLIRSGEAEYKGELSSARRLVRVGGKTLFLATVGLDIILVAMIFAAPAGLRQTPQAMAALVIGLIALGLAGFVGLLAGLSGKPRPSGSFAVVLHLVGQTACVMALLLA
jgi:hypothetical protein